ncbi:sensor histidine kinase [Marinobacter sp. F4206]|uniref:sensor histidine kinase n=1 Tax=Marinobacter sp. F4206 TaxID=2861777 RepID=UPI001C5FEE66|nr:ATP-binding protein [Marinobacter sp. F4206]MBW4936026.1 PAS domain-containing protein [Marinobacter sp. F4206]
MSWITIIWSAAGGGCLTLAAVHFLVWFKSRISWANLAFSLASLMAAATILIELKMMYAQTPENIGYWLWMMHLPIAVMLIALGFFIRFHMNPTRSWLLCLLAVSQVALLAANFLVSPNLNFYEISGLKLASVFGETIAVPVGSHRPLAYLLGVPPVLLVLLALDASSSLRREGLGRRGMVISVTITISALLGIAISQMNSHSLLIVPYMQGLLILIVLVGMAYELGTDLIRGNDLAKELKQTQERMGLVVASAKLGLWEWDLHGDKVWFNDVGKKMLGVSENFSAGIDRVFQKVHPIDVDKVRTALLEAVERKQEIDLEFRLTGSDSPRWMALRGRVERDAKDHSLLVRCVSIDITEQKRVQAQLQEERIELAHMQRVSTMGQLSSALAHEINQPLGAILRNSEAAELFLQRDPPDLDEITEIIRDIKKDEQRASSVIERMRAMLKCGHLEFEPIRVDELVGQVIELLKTEFQLRNMHYALDISPDLPAVTGDRIQLQQVFLNLLSNSFDSIALLPDELRRDRAQILISAYRSGDDSVEVAIVDYGVGIERDLLPRLFTPFVTSKAQGIGLGLSLSQTILETQGGKISAENLPQGGARFRFTLKIA